MRVYDLIRKGCGEAEGFYHGGLFSIPLREDRLGARGFSFWGCIECDDFVNIDKAMGSGHNIQQKSTHLSVKC